MPVTVATLRAIIGLDDSQFQAGVARTKTATREAAQSVQQLGTALDSTGAKEDAAAAKAVNLANKLQTVGSVVSGMGLALTAGVTLPIVGLGVASIKAATDMDSLKRGLIAVSGSSQEADRQLRQLREVAKLPGLGFEDAVRGAVNLEAAGFSADLAKRSLMAFGNALATVGKGKDDLHGVNIALTQMANKSTAFGQDIRQLQERLPQIRQVLLRIFKTADTEAISKMGITGRQVVEELVKEFEKIPKVTGGIKNAFENLEDSVQQALASIGADAAKSLAPILDSLGKSAEFAARVFKELPAPIQGSIFVLAGIAAAAGPVLLVTGTLITAVANLRSAWEAFVLLRGPITAAFASQTTSVTTATGASVANAVAVNSLRSAFLLAIPVIGAFLTGYVAGTALNEALHDALDGVKKGIEDETAAHLKSIPVLEDAYNARNRLRELEEVIAQQRNAGFSNYAQSLENSPLYQQTKKQADELTKQYREAAELMRKGFSVAEAEAKASGAKMRENFAKDLAKTQEELAKLKAPTLEAKLKVEYPKLSEDEIKRLAAIQREIEATKELQNARKKASDEHMQSIEQFAKQVEQARKDVEALRAGTALAQVRAHAPAGAPESLIREMAALKDQEAAIESAKRERQQETEKIKDLTEKLRSLQGATVGATAAIARASTSTLPAVGQAWQDAVRAIASQGGLRIGSGYRPGAITSTGNPSLHSYGSAAYPGAFDVSGSRAQMAQFFDTMRSQFGNRIREMIYSPRGAVYGGQYTSTVRNAGVRADHFDHVHVALYSKAVDTATVSIKAATQATRPLNAEIAALEAKIKAAEYMKQFGEQWNQARVQFLASKATTEEQRISLDTLGKSFESLSPRIQGRIHEMANWRREQDATKESQEATKQALQDELKAYEDGVKAAADAHKHFTDTLSRGLSDARGKMFEATAATEGERIALGFLSDHFKDLPANIMTAAQAFAFLSESFGADTKAARETGDAIASINAKLEKPKESTPKWMEDILKHFEDMKKAVADFDKDTADRIASARRKISGADPSQSAWLDFLAKNDLLAQALANDTAKAAAAQEQFKAAFEAEHLADAMERLRESQREANAQQALSVYHFRQSAGQIDAAAQHAAAYAAILKDLGLTAGEVDSRMQGMIETLLQTYSETERMEKIKEQFESIANDMRGVFERAFGELREHGFKGFFDSIVSGFEDMLSRMAAQFLASQLVNLVSGVIGSAIGAAAGGAGGGAGGGLQAGEGGFAGMAAEGRGPALYIPSAASRVVSSSELSARPAVYNLTMHVHTPDANSFRRSSTQIMEDAHRNLDAVSKRQGRQGQGRR